MLRAKKSIPKYYKLYNSIYISFWNDKIIVQLLPGLKNERNGWGRLQENKMNVPYGDDLFSISPRSSWPWWWIREFTHVIILYRAKHTNARTTGDVCVVQCQYPAFDTVLQFSVMLALRKLGKSLWDLCVLSLKIACSSIIISINFSIKKNRL